MSAPTLDALLDALEASVEDGARNWPTPAGMDAVEKSVRDRAAIVAHVARLSEQNAQLRDALQPFAFFAAQWEAHPIDRLADDLYSIHAGDRGATFRLSDCRNARALLAATDPAKEG